MDKNEYKKLLTEGVIMGMKHCQSILKNVPIFDALQAINAGIIQRELEIKAQEAEQKGTEHD